MLYSNGTQQIKCLCDFLLILTAGYRAGYRSVPREYPNFCLRCDESNEDYCYSDSSPRTRSIMRTRNASRLHVSALCSRLPYCILFLLKELFLDAFAKLRKITISFVMSVRLSVSVRPPE
jgi:hypothetical protein